MVIEIGQINLHNRCGVPALDLAFASKKSFVDRISGNNLITFTRGSTGTYVGSDGLIKTAGINEPRFDTDPSTGESLGFLIEEARTNYILNSQTFTDLTYWGYSQGITVTSNQVTSPDNTVSGTLIKQDTSTSSHKLSKGGGNNPVFTTSSPYTLSLFVKKYNIDRITFGETNLYDYAGSGYTKASMVWDFSTESFVASIQWSSTSQSLILGYSSKKFNNGWYLLTLTVQPGTDYNNQNVYPSIGISDQTLGLSQTDILAGYTGITGANYFSGSRTDFVGDGSSGVYIWGFQVEQGSFPTSYIPTSGSTVTRAADVATITGSNFSSWYNSTEGTVLFDSAFTESVNATASIVFGNYLWATNPNAWRTSGNQGIMGSSSSRTTRTKHAFALKSNDHAVSINGSVASAAYANNNTAPASSGPVSFNANGNTLNGTIARLTYWPIRLPDVTLQAITRL